MSTGFLNRLRLGRVLIVATICATGCGGQKTSTVTVTQSGSTGGVNVIPPATSSAGSTNASGLVLESTVNEGVPVVVDKTQFTVLSAKTVLSIPQQFGGAPLHAVPGARMIVTRIRVKNLGATANSPFCGDNGAVLGDPSHRNWQWNSPQTFSGGAHACDSVQPGLAEIATLVFEVPKAAHVTYIALWNGAVDYQGTHYVDVNLP